MTTTAERHRQLQLLGIVAAPPAVTAPETRHRLAQLLGVPVRDAPPMDDDEAALLVALARITGGPAEETRAWTAAQAAMHPRNPPGTPGAGRFRSTVDRLIHDLTGWLAGGNDPMKPATWKTDPFAGFNREQLRRVAVKRGHVLKPGVSRDDIVRVLVRDLAGQIPAAPTTAPAGAVKVSRAVAGVPGVTTTVIPSVVAPGAPSWSIPKQTLAVHLNGVQVGTMDQFSYGWLGDSPHGGVYGTGGGYTKTAVIRALIARHQAVAVTQTSLPGVTLTPAPTLGSAPGAVSLNVDHNGVDVGDIHSNPGGDWTAFPPSGATWGLQSNPGSGKTYPTKDDAAKALVDAHTAFLAQQVVVPTPTPSTVSADPAIQAAQGVLYGVDPKAKTVSRQLQVYGALRRPQFDRLDPAEQSTLLGDLSYIATTSKSATTRAQAQKLFDRFTPPGTPLGTVPTQAVIPPAGALTNQTRVADPAGTPGLLKVRPAAQRGRSGDGWTRTASGGTGPWGQYGAAGLLLRHVDGGGEERFLMIERGPGISDPGKWQFPGGAKDEKETFHEGAAREVVEELGFKATDLDTARVHGTHTSEAPGVMVPGLHGSQVPWAYVSIAATVPTQLKPDLSGHHARLETSDAKWMTRQEIAALDAKGKLLKPLAGGQLQTNVMTLFPAKGTASAPAGTRPPRLTGTPSSPTRTTPHKPSTGTNLIPDKAAIDRLRQDVKKARARYSGKTADDRLAAIGAMQGFDDTPTVVSRKEMDRLLATGDYIEAWRGVKGKGSGWGGPTRGGKVSGSKTAAQINEEFRSGPAYYGQGIFGNGYYFATVKSIAENYSDGTRGSVVRVLIPKTANIAKHSTIERKAHAASSSRSRAKGQSHEPGTLYDEGRYAAAEGIDMLQIDSTNPAASHVARPGKPAFNILNRSVLIVEEA